jgi:hypothetical protein
MEQLAPNNNDEATPKRLIPDHGIAAPRSQRQGFFYQSGLP